MTFDCDRPKLLVSVRNQIEARDALAGGADWIDLKEPAAGPLGAVDPRVAARVCMDLRADCNLSAALGELADWPNSHVESILPIPGPRVVKLGLAGLGSSANWQHQWCDALSECSRHGKSLASVIYADWQDANAPEPSHVLECTIRAGGDYLLIDTFHKRGLSSIEIIGGRDLVRLLDLARQRGLSTVLAGSLRIGDLADLSDMPVDIIAIRGAACQGDRSSQLDTSLVRHFRTALDETWNAKKLNLPLTTVG